MAKSSSNQSKQISGASTSKRGKSRSSKAKSSSQTKKRNLGKSLTLKGKCKTTRIKTSTSVRGKNVKTKVTKGAKEAQKGAKEAQKEAKEVQKGDETSLIGPDDYLHLFKGAPKSLSKMKSRTAKNDGNDASNSMAIPSDAPTALLAPEDYDHMYTAVPKAQKVESEKARKTSSKKKKKKVVQEVPGVPDDAPTVLKEIVAKERAGQPVNFEQEQEPVEEKNGCCRII